MIIALTGTPGTGKTAASNILQKKGFKIIDLNKVVSEKGFIIGRDEKRDSNIIDIERFNIFVKKNLSESDTIIIEGHLSHLLKNVEKVIILRCHPNKLRKNLSNRNWKKDKINENIEAEILDIILCEAIEIHSKDNIFEIDITDKSTINVATCITEIIQNKFKNMKKYYMGKIDWSEEILKDF